jgi:hypothetical protein
MKAPMLEYRELRIRISADGVGGFRTHAEGPTGVCSGEFVPPFDDDELDEILELISGQVGRQRTRRVEAPDYALVKHFGEVLFDALFDGEIRDLYHDSLRAAHDQRKGLRITLALTNVPRLMLVPWEFLYDEDFLVISDRTPIVRYLDLKRNREPIEVDRPLRILGMVSAPVGVVELDVEDEQRKIDRALAQLVEDGAVDIEWLETATLDHLQRRLWGGPYHVFHYIGHGDYDETEEDGYLSLEDDRGREDRVNGLHLGATLASHDSLRLAVLNSCEGGRSAENDPFAGVASSLVRKQIPAVIAMQFEVTDRMARTFSEWLYESLAAGFAVDGALAQARLAMFNKRSGLEWGTPVLFMRVQDGRIFDVPDAPPVRAPIPEAVSPEEVVPPPPPARPDEREKSQPIPWWRQRVSHLLAAALVLVLLVAAAAGAFALLSGDSSDHRVTTKGVTDAWAVTGAMAAVDAFLDVASDPQRHGAIAVGATPEKRPAIWSFDGRRWSRDNTSDKSGTVTAVAVSGAHAIAAGSVSDETSTDAGFWIRRGRRSWDFTCIDEFDCGDARGVNGRQIVWAIAARGREGFAAVGRDEAYENFDAAVWLSSDGVKWVPTERGSGELGGPGPQVMMGVVAVRHRLVGVGQDGSDGAVWISDENGTAWREVARIRSSGEQVMLEDVVAYGSRLVAVGSVTPPGEKEGRPAAWISLGDRERWNRARVLNGHVGRGRMNDVVLAAPGPIAVGAYRPSEVARVRAAVWRSKDGTRWTPDVSGSFASSDDGSRSMSSVAALAGRTIVAAGSEQVDLEKTGRIWKGRASHRR